MNRRQAGSLARAVLLLVSAAIILGLILHLDSRLDRLERGVAVEAGR